MNAPAAVHASQRIVPAPIRHSLRVRAPLARAFEVFAARMGTWWFKQHTLLKGTSQIDVVIEPRAGGAWYELGADGTRMPWGRVLAWEPPTRIVLAWQLTADWAYDPAFETTVEVRLRTDGEDTVVDFEHRDLERYGERASAQRDGLDGAGGGMDGGWLALLEAYRAACPA